MNITPKFLKKIIRDFLYREYMTDADFRQKFLTKILNPQMGTSTQSQIIFWENSNFQNPFNQQILTPGEKVIFDLKGGKIAFFLRPRNWSCDNAPC